MRQLSAAVGGEHRQVHFDPEMDETELMQLLDDELNGQAQNDDRRPQCDNVADYVSRLHRFISHIDYSLDWLHHAPTPHPKH